MFDLKKWIAKVTNELAALKTNIVSFEHTLTTSLSCNSGAQSTNTYTVTKSGYYPLGVVGWYCANGSGSGGSYCLLHALRITSASSGSATLSVGVRAVGGNVTNCTFHAYILWRKI